MKRLFGVVFGLITFGMVESANAQGYPQFVATYSEPASSLYMLEATTKDRQNAELRFNRGGKLQMMRNGLVVNFSSQQIDPSLLGRKVQVTCANNVKARNSIVVGNFQLPQSPTFNCPADKPYSFFWVQ